MAIPAVRWVMRPPTADYPLWKMGRGMLLFFVFSLSFSFKAVLFLFRLCTPARESQQTQKKKLDARTGNYLSPDS